MRRSSPQPLSRPGRCLPERRVPGSPGGGLTRGASTVEGSRLLSRRHPAKSSHGGVHWTSKAGRRIPQHDRRWHTGCRGRDDGSVPDTLDAGNGPRLQAKGSRPRLGPSDSTPRIQTVEGDVLSRLTRLSVRNYRALADVQIELRPINVVFGPNGAGKSTLLDSLYFFRDCAIRGVEVASTERGHGIGILWDGALEDERISIELANDDVSYALSFSLRRQARPLPRGAAGVDFAGGTAHRKEAGFGQGRLV